MLNLNFHITIVFMLNVLNSKKKKKLLKLME